jgi:ADP-ribose pyrophosphatase YjhB (NUDIX family)
MEGPAVKPGETARQAAARELAEMSSEEKNTFILSALFKKHERRIRISQERRDMREAEAEMSGLRLPLEMPTILDMRVRVEADDGTLDYKPRDGASAKEHTTHLEYKSAVYRAASGIADRKRDRLSNWVAEQGSALDHAAPIGDYIWAAVKCSICKCGADAIPRLGPFVRAHEVAFALGGEAMGWAHKKCNEMEGVG